MTREEIFFILSLEIVIGDIYRMMDGFMICQTNMEYCIIWFSRNCSFIRTIRAKPEYMIRSLRG